MKRLYLTGKTYGNWTVLEEAEVKGYNRRWLCRCSCEAQTEKVIYQTNLTSGKSQSCGCLRRKAAPELTDLADMNPAKDFTDITIDELLDAMLLYWNEDLTRKVLECQLVYGGCSIIYDPATKTIEVLSPKLDAEPEKDIDFLSKLERKI